MKRIICLITALCIVFGSFSFAFADEWGSSQITSVVNNVSSINTTLSNIYTRVNTITNYLTDSNHGVAYWTSAIASWMQPIYTALTSNLAVNLGLEPIISGLNEVVSVSGGGTTYIPWLKKSFDLDNISGATGSTIGIWYYSGLGNLQYLSWTPPSNWRQTLISLIQTYDNNQAIFMGDMYNYGISHFNDRQSLMSFADPDSTVSFTPVSAIDGIYKYLNAINSPLARLGYVLASDSRIEAQEAAAANEQAVVDNFIDSTGAGSASPSDIGSISDLSSGYQNNFGSSASVTGIFNIFDSNNFGWFSQETANQLDTSSNNSRAKSGSEFETPLLDKRINDIYDALGVKP